MKLLDKITPLEENFAKWYQDVVTKGNLIDYGQTKGSMIFKPLSYGIWENIQTNLNNEFKKLGISNVYLPLLIPMSYIEKEKDHIKGFAPELATVTRVGNKELTEPFVIRPTSEVLFGELFSKIINSYNDLPIAYNQWANVLRWEKTTNPFLRNREFLWQEGHTVHADAISARQFSRKMIKLYAKFLNKYLAIPVVIGKKTPIEKFAGAVTTYTIEAMMKDGKALQSGTSHYLAQNFAKPFNISFKNVDNKQSLAFQTSWGISTRLIGGLIMTHGDNRGIIIPPNIAPIQVDIIEIFGNKNPNVRSVSKNIVSKLSRKYRVQVDDSNKGPGFKASKSEIQGTPIRIEVGPRDLEENKVVVVRRDTMEKTLVDINDIKSVVDNLLKDIHSNLYNNAKKRLNDNLVVVGSYDELKEKVNKKMFVLAPFAGGDKFERLIKEETGATARCIPMKQTHGEGRCIFTNKKTKRFVLFAKAY